MKIDALRTQAWARAQRRREQQRRRYALQARVERGRSRRARRDGEIGALLGMGLRGIDIARMLGCSNGKVSKLKTLLTAAHRALDTAIALPMKET